MKKDADDLYAQIEARRIELGLTQAELGFRAFGKSETSAIQNIKRGSSPSFERMGALAGALGYDLYFGPPRDTGVIEHVMIDGADYAHIPLHDALLAAGAGYDNSAGQVVDHIAFRRDWLERLGVTASGVRLARVQSDSMQPTMWAGDLLMIDTTKTEPMIRRRDGADQRRSPIYALIDGGDARVKRVERPSADTMFLISDNPDFAPELRQGCDIQTIKIVGKVVWWGHTARE